jgi:hypothetical protein
MKLSRGVARFNKRVTNRIQGLYAWLVPPWAVIVHRPARCSQTCRPRSARTAGLQRLAMLELEEQLPGFGRRGRLSEPA